MISDACQRYLSEARADVYVPGRGGARRPLGRSAWYPRRRRDPSPWNIRVPAAASPRRVSTEYPASPPRLALAGHDRAEVEDAHAVGAGDERVDKRRVGDVADRHARRDRRVVAELVEQHLRPRDVREHDLAHAHRRLAAVARVRAQRSSPRDRARKALPEEPRAAADDDAHRCVALSDGGTRWRVGGATRRAIRRRLDGATRPHVDGARTALVHTSTALGQRSSTRRRRSDSARKALGKRFGQQNRTLDGVAGARPRRRPLLAPAMRPQHESTSASDATRRAMSSGAATIYTCVRFGRSGEEEGFCGLAVFRGLPTRRARA